MSKQLKINFSAIAKWVKRNSWGIATIGIITIICLTIVQAFKKPGQMSVIESQSMDMSAMLPPKGAVPVGIAKVERREIEGSVTYTGTVQAFVDEDIYPRITGRIVSMPVYPGDKVKKGQLLVQLDPSESEYKAKQQEALFAEDAAEHNAGIAKSEFSQKKYELEATQQAEQAAQKAIEESEANFKYWTAEVEREKKLFEQQVISVDEYQKELSSYEAAGARKEQDEAKLKQATKTRMAAQAALDTMIHHIGHQFAAAKQAKAATEYATTYLKYTRIVAQDEGVVTKRLISPGVTVNPGMMILKIAHINQVRVQAQVASEDKQKIRVGNNVYIKVSESSSAELQAKVTSIFPAADPSSRTFTVEALINNVIPNVRVEEPGKREAKGTDAYRFLPGQYVIVRISTGKRMGLVIPTSAVVLREGKAQVWRAVGGGESGKATQYTCTMHPEVISDRPGKCPKCGMELVPKKLGGRLVAQLADIETGISNPDKTEVIDGLAEGDQVVFAGYSNLQPGMPIVGVEWGATGPNKLPLASEVTDNRLDASNNWTNSQMHGDLMINVSLSPPKSSSNSIVVKVTKHGGGGISGARINIKTSMPGMNMPGPELNGITSGSGEASLTSNFMGGLWQLNISIAAPGQPVVEQSIDVEVP